MKMNINKITNIFRHVFLCMLIFSPSKIKVAVFNFMGNKIGKNCYLGVSYYDIKNIDLGDSVFIGHLNFFRRIKTLKMDSGSRITNINLFTGAKKGYLTIGENSSISSSHYMDVGSGIKIGKNTIIAGRKSTFFSHGISPDNLDVQEKIEIGDWCYIGSNVKVVPGVIVPSYVFVGMGTLLNKAYKQGYVLIGGTPGRILKKLNPKSAYFDRKEIVHRHRVLKNKPVIKRSGG